MRPMDWIFVAILGPSLIAMSAILLANGFEFAEMFWPGNLKRGFGRKPLAEGARGAAGLDPPGLLQRAA